MIAHLHLKENVFRVSICIMYIRRAVDVAVTPKNLIFSRTNHREDVSARHFRIRQPALHSVLSTPGCPCFANCNFSSCHRRYGLSPASDSGPSPPGDSSLGCACITSPLGEYQARGGKMRMALVTYFCGYGNDEDAVNGTSRFSGTYI